MVCIRALRTPERVTCHIGPPDRVSNAPIYLGGEPEPLQHLKITKKSGTCHFILCTTSTVRNRAYMCPFWLRHSLHSSQGPATAADVAQGGLQGRQIGISESELRPRSGQSLRMLLASERRRTAGPTRLSHHLSRATPAPCTSLTSEPAPGGGSGRRVPSPA